MTEVDSYTNETKDIVKREADALPKHLVDEVDRLLQSGAVNVENHSRNILIGVALESIANRYLGNLHYRTKAEKREYCNLKKF